MPLNEANLAKLLWDEALIGIAEVGLDDKFLHANPAFCAIVGYSESELQERTWKSITHPEDLHGDESMVEQLTKGGVARYSMAKRYLTKSGHVVWVTLQVSAYRDSNGKLVLLLSQAKTVAEMTVVEQASSRHAGSAVLMRENLKWTVAAVAGLGLSVSGAVLKDTTLQTTGLTLLGGVFAGYSLSRTAK
jgi:PAS domain S-box-containing protein